MYHWLFLKLNLFYPHRYIQVCQMGQNSRKWRYFLELCRATGRGPSTRVGVHSTNGLKIHKVHTLHIVLHVDTFPSLIMLKHHSHHKEDTPIGRRHCMYKDGGFRLHEKSEGHVNAMFAWGEHKNIQRNVCARCLRHAIYALAYKKGRRKPHLY